MNSTDPTVSRPVARIAAQWFLRMQRGHPSDQERQAFEAWRSASAEHERAWQLAGQLSDRLQALPRKLSVATLERPALISRRAALGGVTSMIVLASLGVALPRTRTYGALTADLRSQRGTIRHHRLPDGSVITLNTDSAVDVQYSGATRKLILRQGEIFVATAQDARPMIVESLYGTFTPVGTRFDIRQCVDHDLLYVEEGKVNASLLGMPETLLTVPAGGRIRVSSTEIASDVSLAAPEWIHGLVRARRMRLVDLLAEFGRYRRGWIRCAPEVAQLEISGVFQLNDIDASLAALAMSFPVRIRYVTRYWVTVAGA